MRLLILFIYIFIIILQINCNGNECALQTKLAGCNDIQNEATFIHVRHTWIEFPLGLSTSSIFDLVLGNITWSNDLSTDDYWYGCSACYSFDRWPDTKSFDSVPIRSKACCFSITHFKWWWSRRAMLSIQTTWIWNSKLCSRSNLRAGCLLVNLVFCVYHSFYYLISIITLI